MYYKDIAIMDDKGAAATNMDGHEKEVQVTEQFAELLLGRDRDINAIQVSTQLHYETLGIDSEASEEEVRQAYKDLVKVWNPERFAHDRRLQEKAERMQLQVDRSFDAIMKTFQTTAIPESTFAIDPAVPMEPSPIGADKPIEKHQDMKIVYQKWMGPVLIILLISGFWAGITMWPRVRMTSAAIKPVGATLDRDGTTPADLTRAEAIMKGVFTKAEEPALEIRAEFWSLIDKAGPGSETKMTELRNKMTFLTTVYIRHFYEDALVSLKTRMPYKSHEREADERKINADAEIPSGFVGRYDAAMGKIARGEPLGKEGVSVLMDEAAVKRLLNNLDAISHRMATLFTRPSSLGTASSANALPSSPPTSAWIAYSSKPGGYTVRMPGAVTESIERPQTPAGPLEYHQAFCKKSEVVFIVAYAEMLDAPSGQKAKKERLDQGRDGLITSVKGKLTSEADIGLSGFTGREITGVIPAERMWFKNHYYIVGRRRYQVMVMGPKAKVNMSDVSEFLNSFKITSDTVAAARGDRWSTFTSPKGRFKVEVPGPVSQKDHHRITDSGKVTVTFFTCNMAGEGYNIAFRDSPSEQTQNIDVPTSLNMAIDNMESEKQVKVEYRKNVSSGSHLGKEFLYNDIANRSTLIGRVYLDGTRTYMVMYATTIGRVKLDHSSRFLRSFRITPK